MREEEKIAENYTDKFRGFESPT